MKVWNQAAAIASFELIERSRQKLGSAASFIESSAACPRIRILVDWLTL
jgi:hypothetical protein